MSDRTEFDDLVRQKLEGNAPAFEEAAWQQVRPQLPKPRRIGGWIAGGTAVLLLLTWALWPHTSEAPSAMASTKEAPAEQLAPSTAANAITSASVTASVDVPSKQNKGADAITAVAATDTRRASEGTRTERNSAARTTTEQPTSAKKDQVHQVHPVHATSPPTAAPAPRNAAPNNELTQEPAERSEAASEVVVKATTIMEEPTPSEEPTEPSVNDQAENTAQEIPANESSTTTTPTSQNGQLPQNTPAEGVAQEAISNEDPAMVTTTVAPETAQVQPAATDTTQQATKDSIPVATTTVQDSAATAPIVQVPSLADPRARWEVSLLGGAFNTTTHYTGDRAKAWESDMQGERTMGFGGEWMHMGPHIGIGVGLYYSRYAERIDAHALSTTTTSTYDSNYFVPVDTTILVVLGVQTVNDQQYYIIDTRDTTINVLVLATGTSTQTLQRRAALQRVNTWSYLEVPLLFDAHLREGRWLLGVRGGPMLCVLQGRRGSLPNEMLDGYNDLADERSRALGIGYTARLYVRYQFHEAWSIGFEPTLRDQPAMHVGEGDLFRSAIAVGGQISLTYRLP